MIVAGRQLDPELREPLAHLARAAGFPILAEPTSQLRCGPHDRSHVITAYDLLLRDERFRGTAAPDLVLRFGEMPTSKPLRSWLAESGADQIVVDPLGDWNEPTRRAAALLRADPTELAAGWAARLGEDRAARRRCGWRPSGRLARRSRRSSPRPTRSPSRACNSPSAPPTSDGDLVYTASSMPIRDQEAFLPSDRDRRDLPLQPRRQRNRRPDLLRHRRRPRDRQADHDRHRRPRPPPRHRRPRRPARRLNPGPHRRHRQRRRRHLPLPPPGGGPGRATSSRRCSAPRAASTSPRPQPSSTCRTASSIRWTSCPTPSPPAPA